MLPQELAAPKHEGTYSLWMDGGAKYWFDLSKYCAIWAKEFDFANKLGAMARQASAESVQDG